MWPSVVFNLCVGLLLAGLLLRRVRLFERRMDAIMARFDEADAASQRAFDRTREEIRASMRAQVDATIAEMEAPYRYDSSEQVIEGPGASMLE